MDRTKAELQPSSDGILTVDTLRLEEILLKTGYSEKVASFKLRIHPFSPALSEIGAVATTDAAQNTIDFFGLNNKYRLVKSGL